MMIHQTVPRLLKVEKSLTPNHRATDLQRARLITHQEANERTGNPREDQAVLHQYVVA